MEPYSESEKWIEAMCRVAEGLGLPTDVSAVRQQMRWFENLLLSRRLEKLSSLLGLQATTQPVAKVRWRSDILPLVVQHKNGALLVVESWERQEVGEDKQPVETVSYWISGGEDLIRRMPLTELLTEIQPELVLIGVSARGRDPRIDEFARPYQPHWFWRHFRDKGKNMLEITLASILSNGLTLAGVLFSMQVYDRVIPSQSYPTLWVLFVGVLLAAILEYFIRLARTHLTDSIGKSIDLNVSSLFFARALAIKNDARPKSTGSFIAQLREIDQIRELLTSVTIGAALDIPFLLLFMAMMFIIGGKLVIIPLLVIPLIIIPGILIQWPMAKLAKEGMREGAIRNAVLIESIEGVEDIKALQAEPHFQRQWEQTHKVSAAVSIKQRMWGAKLNSWSSALQQLSYASILVLGTYLVLNGEITTGTMVACSMLSSRTIAPLLQLTMVFSRWQHAKSAMEGLNGLLKKPLDRDTQHKMAHCPVLAGHYQLNSVQYSYGEEGKAEQALHIEKLEIKPGERVAILGRVGAGKSTLLKLLSGQGEPNKGKIIIDGVDITQIDPMDVRRQLGLLSQDSRLFFGTLRQNLMLGHPHATEQELIRALQISGALSLIQKDASSLDRLINEGGRGLSGGQRQMIMLSRLILRNPQIVMLDEPTASMDENLETYVIGQLREWIVGRTLILVTHRPALLALVNRIVVMDGGKIVLDGPRDEILQRAQQKDAVKTAAHAT